MIKIIISIKKYSTNIIFKEAIICGILLIHYFHINKYKFEFNIKNDISNNLQINKINYY